MAHQIGTIPAYSPQFSPVELCFSRLKTEAKNWENVYSLLDLQHRLNLEAPNVLTRQFMESSYAFCGYPI